MVALDELVLLDGVAVVALELWVTLDFLSVVQPESEKSKNLSSGGVRRQQSFVIAALSSSLKVRTVESGSSAGSLGQP
jgi:hypothetical protein